MFFILQIEQEFYPLFDCSASLSQSPNDEESFHVSPELLDCTYFLWLFQLPAFLYKYMKRITQIVVEMHQDNGLLFMSIGMTRLCNIIHMCKQQLNMRKLKNLIGQLSNHMSNKSKLHYSLYYTYISTIILWRPGKHMYFGIAPWLYQAGRGRRGFTQN